MDKKGINEIKKCFKKEDCRIDRIRTCFINEEYDETCTFRRTSTTKSIS